MKYPFEISAVALVLFGTTSPAQADLVDADETMCNDTSASDFDFSSMWRVVWMP
jgi:hypothetical protein